MSEWNARHHQEDELLSRYLDGELSPEERWKVESRLDREPDYRETFSRMKAASDLLRDTVQFRLTPEEETEFDANLVRCLRSLSPSAIEKTAPGNPLRFLWGLSWQWQAAIVMTLVLVGYIPILMQTPPENGMETTPLIHSDYSNCETFFQVNPEAGYDLYGVLSEEENEPEETPAMKENDSPIGYFSRNRA